jgi:hypothetical protein
LAAVLKRTPKRSFGYVASADAIRARGFALTIDRDPHPNPLPQGERELTAFAEAGDFIEPVQLICPTGKSPIFLSSPICKNISVSP